METDGDLHPDKPKKGREQRFVEYTIERCSIDKGLAARLRRADNPVMEYQSWGHLAAFGVDIEKDFEHLPYVVIAAAIGRAKPEKNGRLSLGKAMVACYEEGRESTPAKARLRRLLACRDVQEACRVLRPVLTLIESKVGQSLDYARLLRQLRFFGERTRTSWAMEFYGQTSPEGDAA